MGDYFKEHANGQITQADLGRFNVTGRVQDHHVFKVPGLRNVARTARYFHDASADTLEEAIHLMARYPLGRELPEPDVTAIEAFLRTLTGAWEGHLLE